MACGLDSVAAFSTYRDGAELAVRCPDSGCWPSCTNGRPNQRACKAALLIWPKHYQTKQVFAIAIAIAEFSTYLLCVNHAHYMFTVVYVFCTVYVKKFWLFR